MRFAQFIAIAGLTLACVLAPAYAEKRVALVVGNGAYAHADRLANPVNDARGVRDALAALKFDVIYGEDLDLKALGQKIGQFAGRADGADVALVYFAGHGATFGDVPYVVPVDAEFKNVDEMPYVLVSIERLIGELRRAKGVRIAILDACRDNGAEQELKRSRGGPPSRGLAPMPNPSGLIIAYATQPGATAADSGAGGNSPFTAALIANIAASGLDVTDMFRKVGRDVAAATGGRQRPEISISMFEQYALVPAATPSSGGAGTAQPGAGAAGSDAAAVWRDIQNTTNLPVIDDFLLHYGNAPVYGALARAKREELTKVAAAVMPSMPPRPPPGRDSPQAAAQERGPKPGDTFRDCKDCPEMVVVPAGSFTMGSPESEKERQTSEGPQHTVTIGKAFAVGRLHVTRDQFAAFLQDAGYQASTKCYRYGSGKNDGSWREPGFAQDGLHPVVCVSWDDANAYANWLAKKTGKPYRLLSEAEFEYAARAGTSTPFWWGSSIAPAQANYDGTYVYAGGGSKGEYRRATVPAGSFAANPWGFYNVHGNAWQWTADCWHENYTGAPVDGSAWTTTCSGRGRVIRGGSCGSVPGNLRAAARIGIAEENSYVGFRLARTLTP